MAGSKKKTAELIITGAMAAAEAVSGNPKPDTNKLAEHHHGQVEKRKSAAINDATRDKNLGNQ